MKKNFTIKDIPAPCIQKSQRIAPKASTLDAIMQFARVYSYEIQMPKGLGAFVAN